MSALCTPRRRNRESGFTLIEVGIAAVLSSMLMSGALMFISDYLAGQSAQAQGQALFAINQAVNSYESTYSIQLANNQPIPIPGQGSVANIHSPTLAELNELGFLANATPAGTYGIQINSTLVGGVPSGLVWITKPFMNGLGSPDQALAGEAMIAAGGDAGMSTLANSAQIVGVDGWAASNPVSGTPMAIVGMRNGSSSGAYLRLDGSTPMQGSINMNNNNVNNAGTVNASTVDSTTANTGTLIAGSATAGTLTATNTTTGTLTATSTSTGTLTASGNVAAGGTLSSSGGITSGGSIEAAGNVSASGNVQASGNIQASGALQGSELIPSGIAVAGNTCATSGAITSDASGNTLSCVEGIWTIPNSQQIATLTSELGSEASNLQTQITGLSQQIANIPTGPQGPAGPQGATGPQGPAGSSGSGQIIGTISIQYASTEGDGYTLGYYFCFNGPPGSPIGSIGPITQEGSWWYVGGNPVMGGNPNSCPYVLAVSSSTVAGS